MIKVDREFIRRLTDDRPYAAIVYAIMTLAYNLNLAVVAEGVEGPEQFTLLQSFECDHAQGYYLSNPRRPSDAVSLFLTPM